MPILSVRCKEEFDKKIMDSLKVTPWKTKSELIRFAIELYVDDVLSRYYEDEVVYQEGTPLVGGKEYKLFKKVSE